MKFYFGTEKFYSNQTVFLGPKVNEEVWVEGNWKKENKRKEKLSSDIEDTMSGSFMECQGVYKDPEKIEKLKFVSIRKETDLWKGN